MDDTNTETSKPVTIKNVHAPYDFLQLHWEKTVLENFQRPDDPYKFLPVLDHSLPNSLVYERFGPSLRTHLNENGPAPVQVVARIGLQLVGILQTLHMEGLLLCDIRPETLAFGDDTEGCKHIMIAELSQSRDMVRQKQLSREVRLKDNNIFLLPHAAINVHDNRRVRRQDDVESVGYILLELVLGELPWANLNPSLEGWYRREILRQKEEYIRIDRLDIPSELQTFYRVTRCLRCEQVVDYWALENILKGLLRRLKQPIDGPIVWSREGRTRSATQEGVVARFGGPPRRTIGSSTPALEYGDRNSFTQPRIGYRDENKLVPRSSSERQVAAVPRNPVQSSSKDEGLCMSDGGLLAREDELHNQSDSSRSHENVLDLTRNSS